MPKVIVLTKKQKVDYYFLLLIDKLFSGLVTSMLVSGSNSLI
jgi:hypothetical protein